MTLCSCQVSTPLNANSSLPNAAVCFAPRSTTRRCMHRQSIAQKGGHFLLFQRVSMLQPTSAIQIPNGEDRRSHRGQDGQWNEPHRCCGRQRACRVLDNYDNIVSMTSLLPELLHECVHFDRYWGSRIIVPSSGIVLNDSMEDFSVEGASIILF